VLLDITGDAHQIQQNLEVLRLLLPESLDGNRVDQRLKRIATDLHPVSENRLSELLAEAGFEAPLRFFQSAVYQGWIAKKK